ncbi:MAG: alpha/beta fold hydrolase, partial [Pseudomonadales bacterium]
MQHLSVDHQSDIRDTLINQAVGPYVYEVLEIAQQRQQSPSVWNSVTELPRILLEATSLAYSWPMLAAAPLGDGHPVVVIPGFTAGDESTLVIRRYLSGLGYQVSGWEQGRNTGSLELQERFEQHFALLTGTLDNKITLIGQSLGGIYARALARSFPDHVRQVITLGSPFSSQGPETTSPLVARLFQYMSGMTTEEMREEMAASTELSLAVPATAIYSKSDGVVHWSSCLEQTGVETENIEILGSHSGML